MTNTCEVALFIQKIKEYEPELVDKVIMPIAEKYYQEALDKEHEKYIKQLKEDFKTASYDEKLAIQSELSMYGEYVYDDVDEWDSD